MWAILFESWPWIVITALMLTGPFILRQVMKIPGPKKLRHADNMRQGKYKIWEREKKLRKFRAFQECPKCKEFNYHWIKSSIVPKSIYRVCRNCGYSWIQER